MFPWAVGPSIGAAAVTALASPTAAAASAALQTVNQVGPLAFALNSIKSASIHQTVPGTNNTLANITTMDQWLLGMAGVASTTGVIGFTEDACAPLSQTPKAGASGGTPSKPFKPIADMIKGGLDSLAGVKPSTGGAGADSSGDSDSSGGSGSGSGGE